MVAGKPAVPDQRTHRLAFHLDGEGGWSNAIYNVTRAILERAEREGRSTTWAAERLAAERMGEPHPVWGHRAREITLALWREGWGRGREGAIR